MNKFQFNNSCESFIIPIYVKDINKPWEEFLNNRITSTGEYIIIEPKVGIDPALCEDDINGLGDEPPVNYGTYTTDTINENEYWPESGYLRGSINIFNIACLKNSTKFKHIPFATFIAMTAIFKEYKTHIEFNNIDFLPDRYIIINTRHTYDKTLAKEYSSMVKEIIAAYNSVIADDSYPNINIAYANDSVYDIIDNINKSKKKKKNKKKKSKKGKDK